MKLHATLPGYLDMAIREIPRIREKHWKVLFDIMKDPLSLINSKAHRKNISHAIYFLSSILYLGDQNNWKNLNALVVCL